MLLEHERDYGLGMDALVIVCSWNMNEIMVWAWMLWSSYALGTRTRLWFGHGCSGHRMLWEHERDFGLGMDALVIVCSGNMNEIMVGHGCSGHRMLWEHEGDYGLGMDALVIVCSWNMNEILVWAWMLWSSYALGTRRRFSVGHGCSAARMLSRSTNQIMVWAWMLWSSYALGTRTRLSFGHDWNWATRQDFVRVYYVVGTRVI